jgi:hypothetical protein
LFAKKLKESQFATGLIVHGQLLDFGWTMSHAET